MPQSKRVLAADVYDAYELSAYAYGIGRILVVEGSVDGEVPCCILGHAQWLAGEYYGGDLDRLNAGRPPTHENDDPVRRINERKRLPVNTRVTWPEYTRELNIVRGD